MTAPAPDEVDRWVRQLVIDVQWLFDEDAARCGAYRWAMSGVGGLAVAEPSAGYTNGRSPDPVGDEASQLPLEAVQKAGRLIEAAAQAVHVARQLLTLEERAGRLRSKPKPGWVSSAERTEVEMRQKARHRQGKGYGND